MGKKRELTQRQKIVDKVIRLAHILGYDCDKSVDYEWQDQLATLDAEMISDKKYNFKNIVTDLDSLCCAAAAYEHNFESLQREFRQREIEMEYLRVDFEKRIEALKDDMLMTISYLKKENAELKQDYKA